MSIDSEEDLKKLAAIGKIVAIVRDEMLKHVKPGISTKELDDIGKRILQSYGARSAPMCEYNFPGFTCISVNDEAAHGIPGAKVLKQGDSVNIDVSAELGGYFADTGATVVVDNADQLKSNLCECSKNALLKAIAKVKAGTPINRIGKAIYDEATSNGFKVIKNLAGHGIGRRLHEEPSHILNYFDKKDRKKLTYGLVLAVETFVSTGARYVIQGRDGWTLRTPDKSIVAQFEHTVIVTDNTPIILTL